MGCSASKHGRKHSSMEGCPCSPGNISACSIQCSVEYQQHVFAIDTRSTGHLKAVQPCKLKELNCHETGKVVSLNEMYRRLVSLEMSNSIDLHGMHNTLGSHVGGETLSTPAVRLSAGSQMCSSSSGQGCNVNPAVFFNPEIINMKDLVMGLEETATQGLLGEGHISSAIAGRHSAHRDIPCSKLQKRRFEKSLYAPKEDDLVSKSRTFLEDSLKKEKYDSGKENRKYDSGKENRKYDSGKENRPCRNRPWGGSSLSQSSQSLIMSGNALKNQLPLATKATPQKSTLSLISRGKRKATVEQRKSEAAESTQQQTRRLAASDRPLSISMSRRILVHEKCFAADKTSMPFFDPDLVASYERALTNISEESWNACLVDSPEVESRQALVHNEQKHAMIGCGNSAIDEEECQNALDCFPLKCPPHGSETLVLYTTTLRGIKKTFEDCNAMRSILQSYELIIDERDVSMHLGFLNELRGLMDRVLAVPRLFIKGRYIGGIEEVGKLHLEDKLKYLMEGIPRAIYSGNCEGCDGYRFVPCLECRGSCKLRLEDGKVIRCPECNENGLIQCPICT